MMRVKQWHYFNLYYTLTDALYLDTAVLHLVKGNLAIWNLDTLDVRDALFLAQMEKGEGPSWRFWIFLTYVLIYATYSKTATLHRFQMDNICKYQASCVFTHNLFWL